MRGTCTYCDQQMDDGAGCTLRTYADFADGIERARIPYGDVLEGWESSRVPNPHDDGRCCSDCGVKAGQLHHPGCHNERCPRCHEQAIGCDCTEAA